MRKHEKEAREILATLYAAYGSDTGHLFGIEPKYRTSVLHIVEFTLEQQEQRLMESIKKLKM